MITKPKRFYAYCHKVYFTYKTKYSEWINEYHKDSLNPWHMWEEWAIFIGFDNRIFSIEKDYYDGHTAESITILGLIVGKLYSYDSEPVNGWVKEDKNPVDNL